MKDIFLGVRIEGCKKIVVVPVNFIFELDFVKTFNNSLNRNQKHLMFWSENQKKEPNFSLPVSKQFNSSTDSCFHVKLLKAFSKCVKNLYTTCSNIDFFHLKQQETRKNQRNFLNVVYLSRQYTMIAKYMKSRTQ